jgi:DNA primase
MNERVPQIAIDKARSVPIEGVLAERNIKLSPGRIERCGPCPICGGTDRFSINFRKQVFNCRRCEAKGDVINLVMALDDVGFKMAVETLAGAAGGQAGPPRRPQRGASEGRQ